MNADLADNPWHDLPVQAPFVLPQDQHQANRFNERARPEHRLHLEIVPEPYLGNPAAPVVLLNLNPGFSETDLAVHLKPAFQAAARANLLHSHARCPFYLLDPELPSPGRDWWLRKLRALIERAGLQAVSRSVFVAEVHGYHSRKFRHQPSPFPSQRYTQQLLNAAIERNALILIMRGASLWHSLNSRLVIYPSLARVRNWQNPSISPGNCPEVFGRVVAAIESAG